MNQPPRTRQELHRELQELLASSKATPSVPSPPTSAALVFATPDGSIDDGTGRRSTERRSTERRSTEKLQKRKAGSEHRNSVEPSADVGTKVAASGAANGTAESSAAIASWEQQWPGDGSKAAKIPCCIAFSLPWLSFRSIGMTLKRHPSIWITSLLVFLVLAVGGIVGVVAVAANETWQRRQAAQGAAINAAVAFERQLSQMFGPLLALATIIRFNPDYKAVNASFDTVARDLLQQMPTYGAVTNLLAAPQGVLRNFYPMEGYCQDHCENININLFKNPDRRAIALATVKGGVLTMQGPMILSQGYFGVVGRQPIYITPAAPNETWGAPDGPAYNCSVCYNATTRTRFWGFVNAVINFETLMTGQDSRLRDLTTMGYLYEMHVIKGGERIQIARSSQLPSDSVLAEVHVPNSTWTLESANEALAEEKTRMDVLLARQYNLISCVLEADSKEGAKRSNNSVESTTLSRIEDMRREIGVTGGSSGVDELQLIELMDEGTYGKVFKGLWRGSLVAVKTMVLPAKMSGQEKRERMAIMEAAISSAIQHPNIVQTFTYIIKPSSTSVQLAASVEEGGSSSMLTGSDVAAALHNLDMPEAIAPTVHNFEVSLVLEFCDWGSVKTALDEGAFFTADNSLNYAAILDTAADVARAMMHLHKNNVLHSDLKSRNVLLKSDASGRGCIAKVADFGLAVRMDHTDTHVSAFQGTMSHMPPEALLHGRISKAGDVYSFGITLWELFTGGTPYAGIPRALIGHNVAVKGMRPELPSFTPPDYSQIVKACWAQEPEQRPTFEQVLPRLVEMRAALHMSMTPPMLRYTLPTKGKAAEKGSANGGEPAEAAGKAKVRAPPRPESYYLEMSTESAGGGSKNSEGPFVLGRTLGAKVLETIHDNEAEEVLGKEGGTKAAQGEAAVLTSSSTAPPAGIQDADASRNKGQGSEGPGHDIEQGL